MAPSEALNEITQIYSDIFIAIIIFRNPDAKTAFQQPGKVKLT